MYNDERPHLHLVRPYTRIPYVTASARSLNLAIHQGVRITHWWRQDSIEINYTGNLKFRLSEIEFTRY